MNVFAFLNVILAVGNRIGRDKVEAKRAIRKHLQNSS